MIREALQSWASLEAPELHLAFLAIVGTASALTAVGTGLLAFRKSHGSALERGLGLVSCALIAASMLLARDLVPLAHYGELAEGLRLFHVSLTGALTATAMVIAATAASARTALLASSCLGLASLGTLVFWTLLSATPPGADPSWEISRLTEFGTFMASGFALLLTATTATARKQRWPSLAATAMAGGLLVVAIVQGLAQHPGPRPSFVAPAMLPLVMIAGWLGWRALRDRLSGDAGQWLRRMSSRGMDHPVVLAALIAAPLMMAVLAVLMAGSGSAREASRVSLGGLSITPGLAVPVLFAVALGAVVGREQWRWRGWAGAALTVALVGLLLAQKEVGNTAVVLMVASVVFLVSQGVALHLAGAGVLGGLGMVAAYQLAPFISAIPFTVRERVHLWLGGAELLQRGGHLVTASYVTFKVGGFWGIGLHSAPGLNLPRLVVAIHTDFPLVLLGLYGGFVLLSVFIVFFMCFAVLLLHTVRTMNYVGDTRRVRRQVPILVGLWAAPVISTTLNLAGAITQVSPFTGVPVAFVSYSSIFILSNFSIVALFILAGNRDAQRAQLRAEVAPPPKPSKPPDPDPPKAEKGAAGWRRVFSAAAWRLGWIALRRRLRFRQIGTGALILMILMPLFAAVFIHRLYDRYTDTTRYFGHPRLKTALHVAPDKDGNQGWRIVSGAQTGPLRHDSRIRVDAMLLGFKQGRLQVRGACYPPERFDEGVTIGFEGMLDAPEVPGLDRQISRIAGEDLAKYRNDIVMPFGDIATHHLKVRRLPSGRFHLTSLSPLAVWQPFDEKGRTIEGKVSVIDAGQGISVGAIRPKRFAIDVRPQDNEICLDIRRGAIFEYPLSSGGPTVLGNMTLLRRQLAMRTTDLTFAEDVKKACEAGIITATGPGGTLEVFPHDPETRSNWDEDTRRRFFRVFRILKIKNDDNSLREVLAWARPFYANGGRRFDGSRELSAFAVHEGKVLGLANSYRFSRVLPTLYDPFDPARNGLLHDRNGAPVTQLLPGARKVIGTLPGAGALLGFDLRDKGVRDGLLRVFSRMMRGVDPLPDVHNELDDQLAQRQRGPWGWDVFLTIDRQIQTATFEALRDEVDKLDAKEPDTVHHAAAIVLGPRNEILALAQMPDTGPLVDFDQIKALKEHQRTAPLDAPALDVFHRRTTMGSTVKLLTLIAGFRHKEDSLVLWKDGEWYINAEDDKPNADRGRYKERGGAVSSWRGQAIAPIRNYGRSYFGKVVPLRTLMVKSLNTGSAYLGMNIGRQRYEDFFADIGLDQNVDLLPVGLGEDGAYGHLLDRFTRDSASALPPVIGSIPKGEAWTLSLTARLPLSGLSDYSVFDLAAGASIIARGGVYREPTLVKNIKGRRDGRVVRFSASEPIRIISLEDAETLQDYMRDVIGRGTAGSYRRGVPPEVWRDTGGKTGTGETVTPVNPNAKYDLNNKPKTRDHKAFVGIWPLSSPEPFLVAVVYEEVSHLDGRVAIRTTQRIMESIRAQITAPAAAPSIGQ